MHGIIHAELKKYVLGKLGDHAWNAVVEKARLQDKVYLPNRSYPDADALALVTAASQLTKMPPDAILRDFGEFIAPDLLSLYRQHVKPAWKTLELLENTETTIHRIVRATDPNASPPTIQALRKGPNELVIRYTSQRKMCDVAKGIIVGLGKHFREKIELQESQCMKTGGPACEIAVRRAG